MRDETPRQGKKGWTEFRAEKKTREGTPSEKDVDHESKSFSSPRLPNDLPAALRTKWGGPEILDSVATHRGGCVTMMRIGTGPGLKKGCWEFGSERGESQGRNTVRMIPFPCFPRSQTPQTGHPSSLSESVTNGLEHSSRSASLSFSLHRTKRINLSSPRENQPE